MKIFTKKTKKIYKETLADIRQNTSIRHANYHKSKNDTFITFLVGSLIISIFWILYFHKNQHKCPQQLIMLPKRGSNSEKGELWWQQSSLELHHLLSLCMSLDPPWSLEEHRWASYQVYSVSSRCQQLRPSCWAHNGFLFQILLQPVHTMDKMLFLYYYYYHHWIIIREREMQTSHQKKLLM